MKALLLQHWHAPELPEIVALSVVAMRGYAKRVGADYRLLDGLPFDESLTAPCNKLAMLHDRFDDYEVVAMVDADMFPRAGLGESGDINEDVFQLLGFGIYHPSAHKRVCRHLPTWTSKHAPYWGGAIYRLPRDHRRALRAHYSPEWAHVFNSRGCGEDEGIMHRLALLAGWTHYNGPHYFGQEWAWPSFAEDMAPAKFIHVRPHPRPRMEQYHRLKKAGVIA